MDSGSGEEAKKKGNLGFMFNSLNQLIDFAGKNDLTPQDTENVQLGLTPSAQSYKTFKPLWDAESLKHQPSLLNVVWRAIRRNMLNSILFAFIHEVLNFITICLLPQIIEYVLDDTVATYNGIIYSCLCVVTNIFAPFFYAYQSKYALIGARNVRNSLICLVFDKVLEAPPGTYSSAELIQTLNTETLLFFENFPIFTYSTIALPKVIGATILLWVYIGAYSLIVIGSILFGIIIVGIIAFNFKKSVDQRLASSNIRIQGDTEAFSEVPFMKSQGWEDYFLSKLARLRDHEMIKHRQAMSFLYAIYFVGWEAPTFGAAVTYVAFALNEELTPTIAVITLAIFAHISASNTILILPVLIYARIRIIMEKIQGVIDMCPKKQPDSHLHVSSLERGHVSIDNIEINEVDGKSSLSGVTLKLAKGDFGMVVGDFSSGSNLLALAVIKELPVQSGHITTSGSIAYVPAQAWLPYGTIRYNITMGRSFKKDWYNEILKACALEDDLKNLPMGDMTVVSMGGSTLSGGQQQRISIARALYADRDIYVLHDSFSALDTKIARHIFKNAIIDLLKRRKKTIIFILNQIEFLQHSSALLVLRRGRVFRQGPYHELIKNKKFAKFMHEHYPDFETEQKEEAEETEEETVVTNDGSTSSRKAKFEAFELEEMPKGVTSWQIFWNYIRYGGSLMFISVVFFNFLRILAKMIGRLWVAVFWSQPSSDRSSGFYIWIFTVLVSLELLFSTIQQMFDLAHVVKASKYFHTAMLKSVLGAPIVFFEKNSIGRIVNRFSTDLSVIDQFIPDSLWYWQNWSVFLLVTILAVGVGAPFVLIVIFILALIFIPWQKSVVKAIIRIHRIDAASRSPLYNHFQETIHGISSIRVYNLEENMREICYRATDTYSHNSFITWLSIMWFTVRCQWFGSIISVFAFFFVVLNRELDIISMDPVLECLGVALSIGIIPYISGYSLVVARLAIKMIAAERAEEYFALDQEEPDFKRAVCVPVSPQWPENGLIVYEKVRLSYGDSTEYVLRGISFTLLPGERVGVVGRTGAGKTSLLQTLLRLRELNSGSIKVDGVDIKGVALDRLRKSFTVIPQKPTITTGTLRENLDPFSNYSDAQLEESLKHVFLDKFLDRLDNGINTPIQDSQMTMGEKQLIAFARAILKNSKIVLLDEPTASLDVETEALISNIIQTHFLNSTVLYIAHHLTTVMDCDKIIVMDKGKIAEFDSPSKLLENPDGIFTKMVNEMGVKTAQKLRDISSRKSDMSDSESSRGMDLDDEEED